MFNGYHEPPATSYNDLELDRGKKNQEIAKWSCGNGGGVQSNQLQQNDQNEIWASKTPFIGLSHSVNVAPKCNCPGCYQLPDNQNYPGDIAWHRTWFSRSYPVPMQSNDFIKLQGNHRWENTSLTGGAYAEPVGGQYVQENGEKSIYYKPYPNLRNAEMCQSGMISTVKHCKIVKDDLPIQEDFVTELGHRFAPSVPNNPGYDSFRGSNYLNQNINAESCRQSGLGQYNLHTNKRPILESFSKTVPSNTNENRVPSAGHPNCKESLLHSCLDQEIGKLTSCSVGQQLEDKHCRVLYQSPSAKELNPSQENVHAGLINHFPSAAPEYHNLGFNRDFHNNLEKKFMSSRNPQYFPRNNFPDMMKRTSQNFLLNSSKDYNRKGAINQPRPHQALQAPPSHIGISLPKSQTYGKFNPNENPVDINCELKAVSQKMMDRYQKMDEMMRNVSRPQIDMKDPFMSEKSYVNVHVQNVYKDDRRSDYPFPRRGMYDAILRNEKSINVEGLPSYPEHRNGVDYPRPLDGSCLQSEKIQCQVSSEKSVHPGNTLVTPEVGFRMPEKGNTDKISHLECIRYEELCKNGTSKISPLRLLRKKKFNHPKKEDHSDVALDGSTNAAKKNETPPLDVRRFWATWAEEEEENLPQTQMVVLDCHNIDPEQAGLLNFYNSEPIRAVQWENGNVLDVKSSQFEKQDAPTMNERTLVSGNYNTTNQNTEDRATESGKKPSLDVNETSDPQHSLGKFVQPVRSDTITKMGTTAPVTCESTRPVQGSKSMNDEMQLGNEKYVESLNNCDHSENPVLIKKSHENVLETVNDDSGKMKEEVEEKFSEEATKSVSSDSSSQVDDLPMLPDLPTSEYRKNKFLDYDNFCNGSFSVESTTYNSCTSTDSVKNAGESAGAEEMGPDNFEIDDLLQKLSGINFQTPEGKSLDLTSDIPEKRKTDKKTSDHKKENRTKKACYKSSRTDQLTLENISLAKPTIKFSIQKSHDLKISFKVLNNMKKKDEDNVEGPVYDGPENMEDEEVMKKKSKRRLITLKLKSESDHHRIKDDELARKNRKALKKKMRSDRSLSPKAPVLKIKKSRYMLNNGCEDEVPVSHDNSDDQLKSGESGSVAHGDFQVHETVESAKIKLTFKRNKIGGEKKRNLTENDACFGGGEKMLKTDHCFGVDTCFTKLVEDTTSNETGCHAALLENDSDNEKYCTSGETFSDLTVKEPTLPEEKQDNPDKSPVLIGYSPKSLQLQSLLEDALCDTFAEDHEISKQTNEMEEDIVSEHPATMTDNEDKKMLEPLHEHKIMEEECAGKNGLRQETMFITDVDKMIAEHKECPNSAEAEMKGIEILQTEQSTDMKQMNQGAMYEESMPSLDETYNKIDLEGEVEKSSEVKVISSDPDGQKTPEVPEENELSGENQITMQEDCLASEIVEKRIKDETEEKVVLVEQADDISSEKTQVNPEDKTSCGTYNIQSCEMPEIDNDIDSNYILHGEEKNEFEYRGNTYSKMNLEDDLDEQKYKNDESADSILVKVETDITLGTDFSKVDSVDVNENRMEFKSDALGECATKCDNLELVNRPIVMEMEILEKNNNNVKSKATLFVGRKILRRCSCETATLKKEKKCRKRSRSFNFTFSVSETVQVVIPEVVKFQEPPLEICDIPLPEGEAPAANCINLEEYFKRRINQTIEDSRVLCPKSFPTEQAWEATQSVTQEIQKSPGNEKGYQMELEMESKEIVSELYDEGQCSDDFAVKISASETMLHVERNETKESSHTEKMPDNDILGNIKEEEDAQNRNCIEYSEVADQATEATPTDFPLEESSPYGCVFDEAMTDDMEEEKVADDDKFRNIMQNCLENAKKFLNVGNLKLLSCSDEDLLGIDDGDQKQEDRKSKDVLLTSFEESGSEDLTLTQCQLLDVSSDLMSSLCPEDGSNLCSEVLPVDNWPYLEEEVPSSPLRGKQEDSDLLSSLLDAAIDGSFVKKRLPPYGQCDKLHKKPNMDGNKVNVRDKTIKNYNSSSWQPKVVLFRISKNLMEELSLLPKKSHIEDDAVTSEYEHEVQGKDLQSESSRPSPINSDSTDKNIENHPLSKFENVSKRKKSRFRNLHTKKRVVPDMSDLTKENKVTAHQRTNLVDSEDSEESSLAGDLPKEESQLIDAKSDACDKTKEGGDMQSLTSRRVEDSLRVKKHKLNDPKSSLAKYRDRVMDRNRKRDPRERSSERRKEGHHSRGEDRRRKMDFDAARTDGNGMKSSICDRDRLLKPKLDGEKPKQWKCEVCGFRRSSERATHIQSHPFHCQSCYLAFKTETNFVKHLTRKHKDIRNQHHCLLCELSFDVEKDYYGHLETREHKHLESVEKNTINTLFTLLMGHPCPVLGPVESKPEWLPTQAGTVHFYHQATPLSLALQYLKLHHDNKKLATETLSLQNK